MYVRPPDDIKKEVKVWKLLKPFYGLDDASRKFYLKVKETLKELGSKTLPGDDAFYHENRDRNLLGVNLSHVDDFTIAGDEEFIKRIIREISEKFTVSKVEENAIRYTGLDIRAEKGKIEVQASLFLPSKPPSLNWGEYWKFV